MIMKAKTLNSMGALHPVLFFAGIYVVVLLFSIFICSALFYSCNSSPSKIGKNSSIQMENGLPGLQSGAAVAMR